MKTSKGTLVAAAVAGLFAASAPIAALAGAGGDGKVHCAGVNDCKGKGGCKSADNACKGKNGCAGKGWMEMSEKDCMAKKGKVVK
jgi:hypothetical protein